MTDVRILQQVRATQGGVNRGGVHRGALPTEVHDLNRWHLGA
jgi:hypothetical protein